MNKGQLGEFSNVKYGIKLKGTSCFIYNGSINPFDPLSPGLYLSTHIRQTRKEMAEQTLDQLIGWNKQTSNSYTDPLIIAP